jgi:hypothetical protein
MPIKNSKDVNGPYYQWGNQKKYYYVASDSKSRDDAKLKAEKQGRRIKMNQRKQYMF